MQNQKSRRSSSLLIKRRNLAKSCVEHNEMFLCRRSFFRMHCTALGTDVSLQESRSVARPRGPVQCHFHSLHFSTQLTHKTCRRAWYTRYINHTHVRTLSQWSCVDSVLHTSTRTAHQTARAENGWKRQAMKVKWMEAKASLYLSEHQSTQPRSCQSAESYTVLSSIPRVYLFPEYISHYCDNPSISLDSIFSCPLSSELAQISSLNIIVLSVSSLHHVSPSPPGANNFASLFMLLLWKYL